jgi:hypothetical protein
MISYNIYSSVLSPQSTDYLSLEDFIGFGLPNAINVDALGGGNFTNINGNAEHDGIISLNITSTNNSRVGIQYKENMLGDFLGEKYLEFVTNTFNINVPTERFYFALGYMQNANTLVGNDYALCLLYDPNNLTGLNAGGITNFILYVRDIGTLLNTVIDTGIAVTANTWYTLGLLYKDGEVSVFNNGDVAVSTNDYPTFSAGINRLTIAAQLNRVGSVFSITNQSVYIDKIKYYSK